MDNQCVRPITRRVFMEKKLFTGKISIELKKRIMKCLVWSVAVYMQQRHGG